MFAEHSRRDQAGKEKRRRFEERTRGCGKRGSNDIG
jgi:hypothetical protein